ncbi:MAG: DegT/DnrJ/EryC1/StrS aminotransferase family protein [Firmicutes bacterium]|jgi:dTDP-4-amino-4,6-dideoxygalactose transaminase|nr:DegT/DnrJ/EryC1/StrS aminotransferase family protein [Bacillota bacterium]
MKENMNIPFSPPDITEEEIQRVAEALRSGWITTGPRTKEFEKKIAAYIGTNKAVCLNSATAAMEMTLRLLGIGPGDEVIVPAYTYTATCSPVCHVGATPVMADIQKDVPEIDYEQLGNLITEKTKAIIPVDLGGIICDYDRLEEVLEQYSGKFSPSDHEIQKKFDRMIVIADSSHGFGAQRQGKQSGQIADFTCFSFHAVKNLTTAEGGAVTWKQAPGVDDQWIYTQYMNLSLHGQTKDAFNKVKVGAWEYDIVSPAYKCNMTDIQASMGLVQLERYPKMLKKRQDIIRKYNDAFAPYGVKVLEHSGREHCSSGHLYFLRIPGISEEVRNQFIIKLAEQGVASNVHYKPLPMMTAYKNIGFDIANYPNAYDFYKNEITLPLYSRLTNEQIDYIIAKVTVLLEELCGKC